MKPEKPRQTATAAKEGEAAGLRGTVGSRGGAGSQRRKERAKPRLKQCWNQPIGGQHGYTTKFQIGVITTPHGGKDTSGR